jgi:glucosamine--fructose-6-phosphate aminotransferase (isomerizing)
MNLEQIEKRLRSFMMKEIYEQRVIKDTYRGHANEGLIQMAGIEDNLNS